MVGLSRLSTFHETDYYVSDPANYEAGKEGYVSARSRFKEIPVHPSILKQIRNIGVGREGKENRQKKRPFEKKRKQAITSGHSQTMSRAEEKRFLENSNNRVRVMRSSGATNRPSRENEKPNFQGDLQLAPPPFGEGQPRHGSSRMRTGEDKNIAKNLSTTTESKRRTVRVLPVKILGQVTSSTCDNDKSDQFPRPTSGLPEVAIVGRSNVGKSTLLNALLYGGRASEKGYSDNSRRRSKIATSQTAKLPKGLKAKTSAKPGETRSIDFYQLSAEVEQFELHEGDKEAKTKGKPCRKKKVSLVLVDLPGYGFAFGPKKERKEAIKDGIDNDGKNSAVDVMFPWQSLIETYIISRPRSSLRRILLLIDARHGMKQADSHFLASLQRALLQQQREADVRAGEHQQPRRFPTELPPIQLVLTKCDLVSQVDLARRVVQVRQQLSDCLLRQPKFLPEMMVSAQMEGEGGVLELQKELASLCESSLTLEQ